MSLEIRKRTARAVEAPAMVKDVGKGLPTLLRLGFALNGLRIAWNEERSFRNQAIGALAMLTTLVILQPSPIWWAIALLCSGLLMALELVNSAIEGLIDHVDPRIHPTIKKIKDLSAAAVIVGSAGVFVMGVIMIVDTLELVA